MPVVWACLEHIDTIRHEVVQRGGAFLQINISMRERKYTATWDAPFKKSTASLLKISHVSSKRATCSVISRDDGHIKQIYNQRDINVAFIQLKKQGQTHRSTQSQE